MCNIKVTLNKSRVCTGGRRVNNTLGNAHSERVQRGYRVGLIRERHVTHERSCVTRRAVGLWASSQIRTRNPVVESSAVCKKISLPLYWLPNRILCMRVYTCVPCRHSFSMNHRGAFAIRRSGWIHAVVTGHLISRTCLTGLMYNSESIRWFNN